MPCGAGTFSDVSGSTGCTKCVAGTYLSALGKASASDCVQCAKGKYSTRDGAMYAQTCVFCRPGSFAESPGSTACMYCEQGKYSDEVAASAASACKEVVVAVKNVVPTKGSSSGGQFVRVEINSFNFSGAVRDIEVQFAGVKLGRADFAVSALSDRFLTILSFTTPSSSAGQVDVTVSETPCSSPCRQVSFKFQQMDESAMRLVSHFPSQGAMQRSDMAVNVLISNFPEESPVTINFGSVASSVSEIKSMGDRITSLIVLVPVAKTVGAVWVNITANEAGGSGPDMSRQGVSFKYTYFDGNAMRTVRMEPEIVPVSTTLSEKFISFRPTVSVMLANLPQPTLTSTRRLAADTHPLGVTASCGGVDAAVKSVRNTATCKAGEFDCNRTVIQLILPPFRSQKSREVMIRIQGLPQISAGNITYGAGCDYNKECPATQIADLIGVASAASMGCDRALCLDKSAIPDPEIISVSSRQGSTLGGQSLLVHFRNLPILDASDITVEVQTSATSRVTVQVTSVSLQRGSTFMGGEGWCNFTTPSVDVSTEKATITLSAAFGDLRRAASFDFEFFKPLTGPAVLEDISPTALRKTDDLRLMVKLSNFPVLKRLSDLSLIKVQIGDTLYPGAVKAVLESNRQATVFAVSIEKPESGWTGDSLAVKFYSDDISRAASSTLQILRTPQPVVVAQFPLQGPSDVATQVSLSVRFFGDSATPFSVSGSATVSEATAKHDAACTQRDCSLHDLKITVPALQSGATAMRNTGFVVSGGGLSTFFNFTYIPAGAAELKMAHPKTQILGSQVGVEEIKVLLDKYPSSTCKAAQTCAKEAAGSVVMFGGVQGTISSVSDVVNGDLALTLLAPLAVTQAQAIKVQITSLGSKSVSFDYTYASYATVRPVDGPVEGGVVVTILAVGLHSPDSVVDRTQLQVRLGDAAVAASDIESVQPVEDASRLPMLKVVLRTLAATKAGRVECTICIMPRCNTSHAVPSFAFTYFSQPSVLKIAPSKVTLDGRTDLGSGSSLVEMTVIDFPKPDTIGQLHLTIDDTPCNGTLCGIVAFSHSAISTKFTIHVPALTTTGLKNVRILFQSAVGGMTRVAESELQYYSPQPVVLSAHWCEECNDGNICVRGGLCKNGVPSLKWTAKLSGECPK